MVIDINALEALASTSDQAVAGVSGRFLRQIANELRRGRTAMEILAAEGPTGHHGHDTPSAPGDIS